MKYLMISYLLLMVTVSLNECSSTSDSKSGALKVTDTEKLIAVAWVDDNTIRVKSTGIYKGGDSALRKEESKKSAIKEAQIAVIEKFITERVYSSGMKVDPKNTGVDIVKEFGVIVKSGVVIKERYGQNEDCELIYEVQSKDLKKRVWGKH